MNVQFDKPAVVRGISAVAIKTFSSTNTKYGAVKHQEESTRWVGRENSLLLGVEEKDYSIESGNKGHSEDYIYNQLNADIPDSLFTFVPPQGAKRVTSFRAPSVPTLPQTPKPKVPVAKPTVKKPTKPTRKPIRKP